MALLLACAAVVATRRTARDMPQTVWVERVTAASAATSRVRAATPSGPGLTLFGVDEPFCVNCARSVEAAGGPTTLVCGWDAGWSVGVRPPFLRRQRTSASFRSRVPYVVRNVGGTDWERFDLAEQ